MAFGGFLLMSRELIEHVFEKTKASARHARRPVVRSNVTPVKGPHVVFAIFSEQKRGAAVSGIRVTVVGDRARPIVFVVSGGVKDIAVACIAVHVFPDTVIW